MHQDVGSVCLIYNEVGVCFRARNRSVSIPRLFQMAWFFFFACCSSEVNGLLVKFRTLLAKTSKTNAWAFSLKVEFFKHFFKE